MHVDTIGQRFAAPNFSVALATVTAQISRFVIAGAQYQQKRSPLGQLVSIEFHS
jgi:hypothetical protein